MSCNCNRSVTSSNDELWIDDAIYLKCARESCLLISPRWKKLQRVTGALIEPV